MNDLKFLLDIQVLPGDRMIELFYEVLDILRENRHKRILPDEQVEAGNAYIIGVYRLSLLHPAVEVRIPLDDLTYISQELKYIRMGPTRN